MKGEGKRIKIQEGDRFGRLTVDSDSGERKNGTIQWNCRCDCGKWLRVSSTQLRSGKKRDCGCVTKVNPWQKDLTGQTFGRLTALYPVSRAQGQGYLWHCSCACGNVTDVSVTKLRKGTVRSCGCLGPRGKDELTGRRFGSLTVLAYLGSGQGRARRWRCRCDCGRELDVPETWLLEGRKTHCGCKAPGQQTDLTGLQFGALTVLARAGKQHRRVCWLCRCRCGRELVVPGANLINGFARSCGGADCRER